MLNAQCTQCHPTQHPRHHQQEPTRPHHISSFLPTLGREIIVCFLVALWGSISNCMFACLVRPLDEQKPSHQSPQANVVDSRSEHSWVDYQVCMLVILPRRNPHVSLVRCIHADGSPSMAVICPDIHPSQKEPTPCHLSSWSQPIILRFLRVQRRGRCFDLLARLSAWESPCFLCVCAWINQQSISPSSLTTLHCNEPDSSIAHLRIAMSVLRTHL